MLTYDLVHALLRLICVAVGCRHDDLFHPFIQFGGVVSENTKWSHSSPDGIDLLKRLHTPVRIMDPPNTV